MCGRATPKRPSPASIGLTSTHRVHTVRSFR
jgi:hypothetical protein